MVGTIACGFRSPLLQKLKGGLKAKRFAQGEVCHDPCTESNQAVGNMLPAFGIRSNLAQGTACSKSELGFLCAGQGNSHPQDHQRKN